jgi:hypothetical protein
MRSELSPSAGEVFWAESTCSGVSVSATAVLKFAAAFATSLRQGLGPMETLYQASCARVSLL